MYRRWSELTALGERDRLLMMALALVDLKSDLGQMVASRLPEYFSENEADENGAIPLSVVRATAEEAGKREGSKRAADLPTNYGVGEALGIPITCYALTENAKEEWGDPLVPDELRSAKRQGDMVMLDGRELVCIEYNDEEGVDLVSFAPRERLDPTR